MARIAFYAPLKSPNHPNPSGDREMARGIMDALADPARDCTVVLVSELRSYDGKGDSAVQAALFKDAEAEAERLIALGGWSAWVTYHNYYKAPDLIGPKVAAALNIPYIQIEATRAYKRLDGPWDQFARAAHAASDQAQAIFHVTERDGVSLLEHAPEDQRIAHLHPFLRRDDLPVHQMPSDRTILCLGMMRPGDKLASYTVAAEVLKHLKTPDWRCEIVGDGTARAEVEALFAPFGDRVTFLGKLEGPAKDAAFDRASVLLWPGVNEAFGMVYLEAQAAGVPVVAENRPGVRDVLPNAAMVSEGDITAMATAIDRLWGARHYWASRATQARAFVQQNHLLPAARKTLWDVLETLMGENA
ncbi:glycosyltransferase family 4 protein [Pelagimonas sp. KU-00592-HH]|uniref:glycosyltransferase family 4 protein n=1 Tax=Pelagimonas sp. KU-00592-HH TaxID=3127651 RepID=UPI00310970D0